MVELPYRKPNRLPDYDYSTPGYYFVMPVIQHRRQFLATIRNHESMLSEPGEMVQSVWHMIPVRFPSVSVDDCVVMPNHMHGILRLHATGMFEGRVNLCTVMHWFKGYTTHMYGRGVRKSGWEPYDRRLWQISYYEHIVRDDDDLDRIREYIESNPANWQEDSLWVE